MTFQPSSYLVLVQLVVNEFVFALFLEGDDDQSDEDVDEEEWKNNEEDDVEKSHFLPIIGTWPLIDVCSCH